MMSTVVLGVDPSRGAQVAARWAADYAATSRASVVAVYVLPRSELWAMGALQIDGDRVVEEFRALLEGSWTAPLRKAGVSYATRIVRGDPATELLRIARRLDATMLVVGAKGHSSIHDLVVGGTVHKIINRSEIPIVLVPSRRRRSARTRAAA
jgi:nucleotide-binding universal stress UspA family protein